MDNVKIAQVLKAAADYIDALVQEKAAEDKKVQTETASKLAGKIKEATGEHINEEIVNKLASTDPEIAALLERLAGAGSVDNMGGPEDDSVKTASDAQGMGSEQRFLNFILG